MTDQHEPIHVLMSRVMDDIGVIGKDSVNQQQGFKFRGIDAVMAAAHRALTKHGVFFLPDVVGRERLDFTTGRGTQMEAVHLHVRFTFCGPAGDSVSCSAWGEASDAGDKATGRAMSMALKSALLQAFCVPTEDTEDADASSTDRGDPRQPLWDAIGDEGARLGRTRPELATEFFTATAKDIRDADARSLQDFLDSLRATATPAPPDPEAEAVARAAEVERIRAQALAEDATLPLIASLKVQGKALLGEPCAARLGGDTTLGGLLDERAENLAQSSRRAS